MARAQWIPTRSWVRSLTGETLRASLKSNVVRELATAIATYLALELDREAQEHSPTIDMSPEEWDGLRQLCQDGTSFEQMQQVLKRLAAQNTSGFPRAHPSGHAEIVDSFSGLDLEGLNILQQKPPVQFPRTDAPLTTDKVPQPLLLLLESERRFRSLIESATDIIVILDEAGIFQYCSPSAERILGYRLGDVFGHSLANFVHPKDLAAVQQVLVNALQQPGVRQPPVEYQVRHRDGFWCTFEAVTTNLLHDSAIGGVVVNCHDITARRQAEERLQQTSRQLETILESITDAFMSLNQRWQFTYVNQQAAEVFQRSPEVLLGQSIWQAFPELVGSQIEHECYRALEQQTPVVVEEFYAPLNRWFEVRLSPNPEGLSLFLLDITERRQERLELLEMSSALGNAVEGIARLDCIGRYVGLNRAYAAALGYEPQEIIGMDWKQTIHSEDIAIAQTAYQTMLAEGKAEFEARGIRKDGSTFFKNVVMVAAYDWNDRLTGHHCFTKDITERKRAESALRTSEERLRLTLQANQMGTWEYNPVTQIARWSESCERLFGLEPGTYPGTLDAFLERVHPDDRPQTAQIVAEQLGYFQDPDKHFRIIRPDGEVRWILERSRTFLDAANQPIQIVGVSMDVTEQKRAEDRLRQQTEREQLLRAITQRIHNSLDLAEILNATALGVRQFLRTDRVLITQLAQPGGVVVLAESVEAGWSHTLGTRIQDGFLSDWMQQSPNLVVDDVQQCPMNSCLENMLEQWQMRACLAVPILNGEQLWGLLIANHCAAPRQWEAFEISLLEQLADQLAIAIQQSELYQQVQQLNTDLEQQVQERTAQLQQALHFEAMLTRITDAVRDSLTEETILQTAVRELAQGLQTRGCDASLHNLEAQTLKVQYEFICSDDLPPALGSVVPMADFAEILAQLHEGRCAQYCRIVANTVRAARRPCAVLVCSIRTEQEILGSLWLFKPCQETFSNQEVRVVQQVANQCAIAIRQARLYQASQAQVATLEELHQLKDDFLSTVSHELRTPMSNMKMAIRMLQNMPDENRRQRYLDILEAECGREIELINDLLDLQRLEAASYQTSLENVNLTHLLQSLIEPFLSRAGERQQVLRTCLPPELPAILTDRASLERLLAELLNNACKYTPPNGEIALTVHSSLTGPAHVVFQVRNQAEIPKEELPRIFNKFYRVLSTDQWKQGGTGLGLALVQRLVTQLNGTIAVESGNGWTVFTVTLPIAAESTVRDRRLEEPGEA